MSADVARGRPLFPARPPRRSSPALRTARDLLAWFVQMGLVYWAIVLVAVVAVPFVVDRFGAVEVSIVWFARQSGIWFPFSVLIGVAATYPTVHVASGMTRRAYVRGALLAAVVLGTAFALVMSLLLEVERAWYGAMGWGWRLQDGWFAPDEGFGTVLLAYVATFVVANLSGVLVGTVYGAAGGWWGTLTLPLTVGPVFVVIALVDAGAGWLPFADLLGAARAAELTPLAVAVVAAVLAASLAVAFHLIAVRRSVAPRRG